MLLAFVTPTRVYLLDIFCFDIQFYLDFDLYVLGDDAWIS